MRNPIRIARIVFGAALIQSLASTDAAELRGGPGLSLHNAIEAAWARVPERNSLAARQAVAAARYGAGGAIVPNAPTATGSHVNDRIAGSNYNYITTQIGVSTPIWLPGEGTATQRAATAEGQAVDAQAAELHLTVAARVIELAAKAALAANARDVAARRLATDKALASDLANRFAAGESSESDALAADAEAATASVSLIQAEATLAAARITLAATTGTETIPDLKADEGGAAISPSPQVIELHPSVAAAQQAVDAARAKQRLVTIQNRDDPELGLEGINEKQPGTRWDTRVGVTFTFHFATEARNGPRRAEAAAEAAQAEVALVLARRAVATGISLAQAALAGSERARASAERAAAELEKRRGQIERAWRVGEMPFVEYVRANAQAFDASAARDEARTVRQAALLQLQLAAGRLP